VMKFSVSEFYRDMIQLFTVKPAYSKVTLIKC